MSTGVLYKKVHAVSEEAIEIQRSLGSDAIEIACIRKEDLPRLLNLDAGKNRQYFRHFSLHAPSDIAYGDNAETRLALTLIEEAHRRLQFDLVVIHPESVRDWGIFENVSFPFGIENADHRKGFGQTVEDLEGIFKKIGCGSFVLDVNHCFANDASMALAEELLDNFYGRLGEVHLSGFIKYHEPLCVTGQEEILRAVPIGNHPIILEGVCDDVLQAREELEYVREYLDIS